MQTEILGINEKSLNLAKNIILCGRTVVFPTETVYGLGANAFDESSAAGARRGDSRYGGRTAVLCDEAVYRAFRR